MTTQHLGALLSAMMDSEDALHAQAGLFGAACSGQSGAVSRWVAQALEDARPDSVGENELREAAQGAVGQLATGELQFVLGLPGDDEPLPTRVSGLATWCQGFLVGLVAAGLTDFKSLPGDSEGFIADVTAMREASAQDTDEAAERQFVELVEYLRVGVQQLYEDRVPPAVRSPASGRT